MPYGQGGVALTPLTDLLLCPVGQEPLQVPLSHVCSSSLTAHSFKVDDESDDGASSSLKRPSKTRGRVSRQLEQVLFKFLTWSPRLLFCALRVLHVSVWNPPTPGAARPARLVEAGHEDIHLVVASPDVVRMRAPRSSAGSGQKLQAGDVLLCVHKTLFVDEEEACQKQEREKKEKLYSGCPMQKREPSAFSGRLMGNCLATRELSLSWVCPLEVLVVNRPQHLGQAGTRMGVLRSLSRQDMSIDVIISRTQAWQVLGMCYCLRGCLATREHIAAVTYLVGAAAFERSSASNSVVTPVPIAAHRSCSAASLEVELVALMSSQPPLVTRVLEASELEAPRWSLTGAAMHRLEAASLRGHPAPLFALPEADPELVPNMSSLQVARLLESLGFTWARLPRKRARAGLAFKVGVSDSPKWWMSGTRGSLPSLTYLQALLLGALNALPPSVKEVPHGEKDASSINRSCPREQSSQNLLTPRENSLECSLMMASSAISWHLLCRDRWRPLAMWMDLLTS